MEEEEAKQSRQFEILTLSQRFSEIDLSSETTKNQDLLCAFCLNFPEDPIQCLSCKANFCKDCVAEWKSRGKNATCANGCEDAKYGKTHPFFLKSLMGVKVKCKNEGCSVQFLLEQSKNHELQCEFATVKCHYCQKTFLRKEAKDHSDNCEAFDCQECGQMGAVRKSHSCVRYLKDQLEKEQFDKSHLKVIMKQMVEKIQKLQLENIELKTKLSEKGAAAPLQQNQLPKKPVDLKEATILCKKWHKMELMRGSPYFLRHATCDKCWMKKISKYSTFFFHCKVCGHFDLCQSCAAKQL